MRTALVDQDIQPADAVEARADGRLDLAWGVEGTEDALAAALGGVERTGSSRGREGRRSDGIDALFTTSRLPVTADVLDAASDLAVVAKIGTGIDSVDCAAAADRGVAVTYTPGMNARAVAEFTVALALAATRNLVATRDRLRDGGWRDDAPLSPILTGKTVGIVGFGDVGSRVAGLLSGFHVDVLAHDPYVDPIDTDVTGATLTDLDDLLARSDVVTVNAELTGETRGLIGAREFARMKESAVLVNTARGPIVSETALLDALAADEIAGAALDVFETEPLPADSPLHDNENVITTPHVAATTRETRIASIDTLVDNALALLDGDPVPDRYLATPPI